MRTRREKPAFFLSMRYINRKCKRDGIRKQRIEVRFGAINVWQNTQQLCGRGYIFLIMILPDCKETFSPVNLNDGARPMWAE